MKIFLSTIILVVLQFKLGNFQTCGQTAFNSGLVINGDEINRGEFPFLVALLHLKDQKFFCGANLVSLKHALTAAHCIQEKDQPNALQAEDILAQLGKHNLKHIYEKGSVAKEIHQIIMHEDWKPYVKRYDADIALLIFESEVQLSEYIRIVCIPTSLQKYSLNEGQVVGWGVSERTDSVTPEDTPRKAMIKKPPSNENCFLKDSQLTFISSNRTYCAGGEFSGPCKGDSGGGFYVLSNSVWYLQGIVSSSILTNNRQCDIQTFAVYTNVAFFTDWIWEKINGFKSITIRCDYDISDNLKTKPYYCATNLKTFTDDNLITSTQGDHLSGKSNADVILLDFSPDDDEPKRDIHYIPSGISNVFPYLRILYIQNCKLTSLSRKNFKRMSEMNTISLTENDIEFIDEDTFYEVPKLYSLRVNGNRLKTIPLNLFTYAPRLQHFIMAGNKLEEFDGDALFAKNPLMKSIDLEDNKLNRIKIHLPSLRDLVKVDFENNVCIHARVGKGSSQTIQQVQGIINTNCKGN